MTVDLNHVVAFYSDCNCVPQQTSDKDDTAIFNG